MAIDAVRRAMLLGPWVAASGCAGVAAGDERIVDVASGRALGRDALLAAVRDSDVALLGEQHDNPLHHARRGALLAALPPMAVVVAEHLTRGQRVRFGADLLASLNAAGFDAQGWRWPLHESLFGAVQRAGLPLLGGNLPPPAARRVAREGASALDEDIAALLHRSPLDAPAEAALDDALVQGHCGQLRSPLLERMRLAQRGRDAAMALALHAAGGRPTVLLAGNGHVRTDHGVPSLLRTLQPKARVVSVGFVDADRGPDAPYTHLWLTPPPRREDPCAGFSLPPARPS